MSPMARALVANSAGIGASLVSARITLSGLPHLLRKILVAFEEAAVGQLHRRMIGTQFVKEDIKGRGFRALSG